MNREFYGTVFFSPAGKLIIALLFLIPVFIFSCNIINPAEPVPSYIHVDTFSLSTNPLTQGSNSNKVTDVWAFVDGNLVGAFELPATFPVLTSGSHNLTLRPGILENGIAATRTIYPFYTGYDTIINFESGKIKTVAPLITYYASAKLKIEDFDQSGRSIVKTPASETDITAIEDQQSLEGKYGYVLLDNSHTYFECAWKDSFPLPVNGPAFIELNYKGENPFTVGLKKYMSQASYSVDIINFKASETWKKEYVNLDAALTNVANATGFKIYIKATKSEGISTASLYFDNIKVVY